jgi:integrase
MAAHKTPDGRWRVWLNLGADPATGRRIRKKIEAKTKREAESKAKVLRDRHTRGENISDKPRTLTELLDEWLATIALQGKAANTLTAYRGAIKNHLKPTLGAIEVPRLQLREIQRTFNDLAERLAPSNIRLVKTVLASALNLAIEQREISINPADKVRLPAAKRSPGRTLSPAEVLAVLAACDGQRYGLAVRLALLGLRRSELPGLRWEDFDAAASTLRIGRQLQKIKGVWTPVEPKDGSARTITLGPKLIAALQLHRRAQQVEQRAMEWADSGYIFISTKTGGACPATTIYASFKDIARAAGVDARLHDCRHTAATKLLSEGEDIATVAEVLGHANPQVTAMVYAHALPHKVANASRRLEDLYSDEDEARRRHG